MWECGAGEALIADEEAVAGIHGTGLEEAVGAVFPCDELMGVAMKDYELIAEGEADSFTREADAPDASGDLFHGECQSGVPVTEFGDVANKGEHPIVTELAGFTDNGGLIGHKFAGDRACLLEVNGIRGMRAEGEREEAANLWQTSPSVPNTKRRHPLRGEDA